MLDALQVLEFMDDYLKRINQLEQQVEKLTRENGVHLLVNGETARQTKHAFILKELGTVEVKGRRKPVDLFQVVGEKS